MDSKATASGRIDVRRLSVRLCQMNSIRRSLIIATLICFLPISLFAGPDPPDRRKVLTTVPTSLRATMRRDEKGTFDVVNSGTKRIKLSIRSGFYTGINTVVVVRRGGEIVHSIGGIQSPADLSRFHDVVGSSILTDADADHIYYTISIFETDIPPQHLWSPEWSRAYKVLWSRTFRTTSK
jgi:hypothetical protein